MRASPRAEVLCAGVLLVTGMAVRAQTAADTARSAGIAADAPRPVDGSTGESVATPAGASALPALPALPAPTAAQGMPLGESTTPVPKERLLWLDDVHDLLYNAVWRSAMHVDRWFGSEEPDVAYEQASGSIAPALLWDQYHHWRPQLRFVGDVPLPQLSESVHAFIGRLNPEEFISESQPASGALPNPYAQYRQDQTLFGIQYYQPPRQGAQWEAGVGLPITLSRFNPYVKGGYIYQVGMPQHGVLIWRQDLFYQDSQGGFGVTSRLDLQRLVSPGLLLAWTGSTTYAQRSYGWRSYSTFDAYMAFPNRRALIAELEVDGATQAAVPVHDYGWKIAYRRSIMRDWLILEVRTSLDWPKDYVYEQRRASWGLGVGFEMQFGTDVFLARPVTF